MLHDVNVLFFICKTFVYFLCFPLILCVFFYIFQFVMYMPFIIERKSIINHIIFLLLAFLLMLINMLLYGA